MAVTPPDVPDSTNLTPRHAPARRATDAYIGSGFLGIAGFCWIVTVRVWLYTSPIAGLVYGAFAVLVTVAGLGIVRLVVLHRLGQRRRMRENHHHR
jgi:hypothetical protein